MCPNLNFHSHLIHCIVFLQFQYTSLCNLDHSEVCFIEMFGLLCLYFRSFIQRLLNIGRWSFHRWHFGIFQSSTVFFNLLLMVGLLLGFFISMTILRVPETSCQLLPCHLLCMIELHLHRVSYLSEFVDYFIISRFLYFGIQISHNAFNFLRFALSLDIVQCSAELFNLFPRALYKSTQNETFAYHM